MAHVTRKPPGGGFVPFRRSYSGEYDLIIPEQAQYVNTIFNPAANGLPGSLGRYRNASTRKKQSRGLRLRCPLS